MPPQFVGIQDSGEHRTSGEGAQGGVNPRCAAAGEAETSEGEKRSDGFWVAGHTQNSSPAERRGARYPAACPPRGGKHVTVVAQIEAQSSGQGPPPGSRSEPAPTQAVFRLASRSLALHVAILAPKQARGSHPRHRRGHGLELQMERLNLRLHRLEFSTHIRELAP